MSVARRRAAGVSAWAVALALALAAAPASAAGADDKDATADAEIAFNTGLTHLREGRTEMAVDSFKKAIKRDPKNAYFHKGLAVAQMQLADRCAPGDSKCRGERLFDAVTSARKALEINPYYVDARNDLGAALIALGKREEGKRELLAAYEDPTNPTPELSARNLGQAYMEERSYPQAESWFRTCLERNRNYPGAYVLLADAMTRQNRVADALAQLEAGEKLAPDDPSLLLEVGLAYQRAGRLVDARTRWEKAAAKDPGGPVGRRALDLLRALQQH